MVEDLFSKFSTLLERGLEATAAKITGEIKADLQNIGSRMDAIEGKLDQTAAVSHQNSDLIQSLQDQLDTAFSRIDDLENRPRRLNFRIRGLPETILTVTAATQELMKSLIPNIPSSRLELDRVHRTLGPPRKDGSLGTSLPNRIIMTLKKRS